MQDEKINKVYFVGIGGIGMSALARYFHSRGLMVAGYDRVSTMLTRELEAEGMAIHYSDDLTLVPTPFLDHREEVMVVYTPAIPSKHTGLSFFRASGYPVLKRAEVLGYITRERTSIAVAGTHGKTSISTMTAHLLHQSGMGCSAFLGGISKNYNTNFLVGKKDSPVVVEADEFDRSFLQLSPTRALITSTDADHLDIYGSHEFVKESFQQFVERVKPGGDLVVKHGLAIDGTRVPGARFVTYSLDNPDADSYAKNRRVEQGYHVADLVVAGVEIKNARLGIPGLVNLENAVAAATLALLSGVKPESIREGLASFEGVKRRFDTRYKSVNTLFIDDYAHHPEELRYTISSVRELYPGKKITGVFQPHLFTRTRDFANDFAKSLDLLDELFLLEIYPARELPIEGVSSAIILDQMKLPSRRICSPAQVLDEIKKSPGGIWITLGAGDIDLLADTIAGYLEKENI